MSVIMILEFIKSPCLLGGIIFLTLSAFKGRSSFKKTPLCKCQTEAVVKNAHWKMKIFCWNRPFYFGHLVLAYTADGKEMVISRVVASYINIFKVGQRVTLFYNPDKVQEYYIEQDIYAASIFFYVSMSLIAFEVIISLVCIFLKLTGAV